ncbi:MAG TPA: VTT domain-containing protein [Methylomirabilota bacterium]|jgi:membrane protein DedA with SNARE-associated domain
MDGAFDVLIRYGYIVVFAWVLLEQIGVPLPAIPVLMASGALAGSGRLSFALLLALAGIASLIGDTVWYWLGRVVGGRVLGWLCRISLEPDSCVRKTHDAFSIHGPRALIIAKFIPGFSTAAPPLAGIVRMPVIRFLVFTGLGGLIWSGTFIAIGWVFSAQLEMIVDYISRLGGWAVVVLVAGFVGYVASKYVSRQRFLRRIRIARITPEELKAKFDAGEDTMVVDVRHQSEFDADPIIIPGALHLTTEELERRHQEIPRGRDIVLYCT